MNKFKVIVYILSLILWSHSVHADFHPEADAELESTQIWTNAYFKSGSNVAVMQFRVWFKQTPDKVFAVLTDTNSFKSKMSNYKDSRTLTSTLFKTIVDAKPETPEAVIKLIGANQISSTHNRQKGQNWTDYMFLQFNFPWPLTDRWLVQKASVDETNAAKGEYKFSYKMDVGNFQTLFGSWQLKPVEKHPGWTEFYGEYESDAGVSVPKFVTKKAIGTGFRKDIDAYRRILNSK